MRLTHRPAKGNINTQFGPRPKPTPSSPAIHYGQDYGWGGGDEIVAGASGRVKSYAYTGAYGNRLVIEHGNGFETWYCHLARNYVAVGVQVSGGQRIAEMGSTGNVVGKHLHFEVRLNGVAVNPAPYFNTSNSTAGNGNIPLEDEDMAEEASVQEAIRIGNATFAQQQWIIATLAEIKANQADDATEASVQEAVRVSNEVWARTGKILSAPASVIDVAKLAAALKAAGIKVEIDGPALVKLLEASLADDFKAIPKAVNDDAAKRLSN